MTTRQFAVLLSFILTVGIIIGALAWDALRPAEVVKVSGVARYDTTVVTVKVPYYPEASHGNLSRLSRALREAEGEIYRERERANRWAIAWMRQVSDELIGQLPSPIDDYPELVREYNIQRAIRFGEAVDTTYIPDRPLPPTRGIKWYGLCFLPGISAGVEVDREIYPCGYIDVELAWARSLNLAIGVNNRAVKPVHLRYRLPIWTRNLMVGGYIAKPYGSRGWRPGVALSVSF